MGTRRGRINVTGAVAPGPGGWMGVRKFERWLLRSEEAAEITVCRMCGDRGWQAHSSCTVRAAHLVPTPTHTHTGVRVSAPSGLTA